MRVVLQIGYAKASNRRREGQLVRAWINEEECSWQRKTGKWLTSRVESQRGVCWYLWEGEVSPEDVIRIEAKTSVLGAGTDERRTFESLYYVDPQAPIKEVNERGVGARGYPLAKGRLVEVGSVSEADKRESEIEEFLDEENF